MSGVVLVNGLKQPENFKCITGYVVQVGESVNHSPDVIVKRYSHFYYTALFPFQEDVVMGTLTVRENLHFSASLRLPNRLNKQQRKERVEATLSDLGLFHVAESKVCSCCSKLKVLEEWFIIIITLLKLLKKAFQLNLQCKIFKT